MLSLISNQSKISKLIRKGFMQISDLLDRKLISLELKSTTKWEAISELTEILFINKRIATKELFLKAVKKREEQVSTGVGLGIAIPHGISDSVILPSIAFGRSERGVKYDSIDQNPVNLLFLLAIPETYGTNQYMRTLANLARLLVHDSIKKSLLRAASPEEILEILNSKSTYAH